MSSGIFTVTYPIKDLDRATALLGATPELESPYYVQFIAGEQRLGHSRGFSGSVGYWQVEVINARVQEFIAAGAVEHEAVTDVGNGSLIASVKEADGNVIGLIQSA